MSLWMRQGSGGRTVTAIGTPVVDTFVRQVRDAVHGGDIATVTGMVLSFMGLTLSGLCVAMGGAYVTEQVPGHEAWTVRRLA
jgi:hypothetical protein